MTTTPDNPQGGHRSDEAANEPIINEFSDFSERVKEVLEEDTPDDGLQARTVKSKETLMPKIRGLDILKEGGYEVDFEKTIQDMFAVIKNMESQLEKVMGINDLLEKDLKEANALNAELKTAKSRLENRIARMEDEVPSKRELQIENDHLIDERNSAQLIIRDLKLKLEKTQKKVVQHQQRLGSLGEERKDALQEVNFLESRLNNATQKIRDLEKQCNELKGEKIAQFEKIQNLDQALSEALDEKYRLHRDLKETKKKEKKAKAELAIKKRKVSDEQLLEKVKSTIEKASRQGIFESSAERAIFDKVASDLLDNEMEIKTLAAAELGKLGNEACVSILLAAAEFDNPELTSEIINSLTGIGAHEAVALFKEKVSDSHYRIRIGSLRGLHKLAEDEDTIPLLTEALQDSHSEVRRTAATFLGWKDSNEAVPALMQSLRDDDVKVRKAAVSALANIKDEVCIPALIKSLGDKNLEIREKALETISVISGEEIDFDVHQSGKTLKNAVAELRSWWEDRKIGELDADPVVEPAIDDEAADESETPAPEADVSMDDTKNT